MPTTNDRPDERPAEPDRWTPVRSIALGLATLVVLAAAVVLVRGAVITASARLAGSTENTSSLMRAGEIRLDDGPGTAGDLMFDGTGVAPDGLYPGLVVDRCVAVHYKGTVTDIPLRLSVELDGGTGLERHLTTEVTSGAGTDAECDDFVPSGPAAFTGTLGDLAARHPDYEAGLWLADLTDDERAMVRIRFEVDGDNDAQGRTTQATVRFEVRP